MASSAGRPTEVGETAAAAIVAADNGTEIYRTGQGRERLMNDLPSTFLHHVGVTIAYNL